MATWFQDHPMVAQIRSYQFNNVPQENAAIHTYFDLTEVKQWYAVTIQPCVGLQMVYLAVQHAESSEKSVLIPLPANTHITMDLIQRLFQFLPPTNQATRTGVLTCTLQEPAKLTLGLVDNEGTITYYHLHQGLCPTISET